MDLAMKHENHAKAAVDCAGTRTPKIGALLINCRISRQEVHRGSACCVRLRPSSTPRPITARLQIAYFELEFAEHHLRLNPP